MTNEEHNKYIAWAFIANGAFQFLILGLMFVFFAAIFSIDPPNGDPGPPIAFFAVFFAIMFIFHLVFNAPSFVAAYAILKRKPWARIAGIVAAAMSAMNVPLGTLAAVYSLWFFCGDQWKEIYPETAGAGRVNPLSITAPPETKWEGYTTDEEGAYVYRTPPPPDWR